MNFLASLLGRLLRFIYESLVSFGNEPELVSYYALSLMVITLIIKIITIPITLSSTKQSEKLADLQPELQKLEKKYGYDQEVLSQKQMEFYKENNIKMTGGCLPLLLQLIIILALFRVMRDPAIYLFEDKSLIASVRTDFLWIPNLNQPDPYWYGLPLLNSALQLLVSVISQKSQPKTGNQELNYSTQMMSFMMPLMLFFLMRNYASGLILYWITSNLVELVVRLITLSRVRKKERILEVDR